jgi:hypothetical protein
MKYRENMKHLAAVHPEPIEADSELGSLELVEGSKARRVEGRRLIGV